MTGKIDKQQMESLRKLQKLQEEPLHPDLVPYLYHVGERDLPMLKHPLIYDLLPINGLVNRNYEDKKKALAEAIEKQDWAMCVWLHERAYRTDALIDYVVGRDGGTNEVLPVKYMSPEVRELVCDVWRDSENIEQHIEDWKQMLDGWEPGDLPMFCDDPEGYRDLPDLVTVWRGDVNDGRWSWSLDKGVALFFARRYDANVPLLSGIVRKDCIFGYLTGRSENEVMCQFEHVMCVTEHKYEPRKPVKK